MAIVKLVDHHKNAKAGIDYILNPDKTQGLFYTSTINCSITPNTDFTAKQFDKVQRFYQYNIRKKTKRAKNKVNSLHIIQSFKGQEASPEKAHQIARELVQSLYGSYAQAVIATHADKDNVHNHIIVNSVDIRGNNIYSDNSHLQKYRDHSDILCKKYDLSVIEKPYTNPVRINHYKEWLERSKGSSWKENIRNDIDKSILATNDWQDFKDNLTAKGYKINDLPNRKHITLQRYEINSDGSLGKPLINPDTNEPYRAVRLSTLGYAYTEDSIKQRLIDPNKYIIKDFSNNSNYNNDSNSNKKDLFVVLLKKKRMHYTLVNNLLALQYLNSIEIAYRLIVNNLMKKTKKLDLSKPYTLDNDYILNKNLYKLAYIESNNIKSKKDLDYQLTHDKHYNATFASNKAHASPSVAKPKRTYNRRLLKK